jgi:hypothetical protein
MKRLLLILFFAACPLMAQQQPVVIPIQNPSFEQPVDFTGQFGGGGTSDRCGSYYWNIPGWSSTAGTFEPVEPNNPCLIKAPPDGSQVAYGQAGATFTQDTGAIPSVLQAASGDGLFTLSFYVDSYTWGYPGYYEAKVLYGSSQHVAGQPDAINAQELCEADGWATHHWTLVSISCPSPYYIVYDRWPDWFNVLESNNAPFDPNAHVILSFTAPGWMVMFDSVSLTFTPQ